MCSSDLPDFAKFGADARELAVAYMPHLVVRSVEHRNFDPIVTASIGVVSYVRTVRD